MPQICNFIFNVLLKDKTMIFSEIYLIVVDDDDDDVQTY